MPPIVAIIGRPNVGKSSLLNALAKRMVSIVDPTAGVTRDRVSTTIELAEARKNKPARHIELIDTGGYGIEDSQNLTEHVERQIDHAITQAQVILFVLDAQTGIVPLDQEVARLLRKQGGEKRVILVANKVDSTKQEALVPELMRMGFGDPVAISALTGHNVGDLRERLLESIDFDLIPDDQPADTGMLLAIVGKRNAGKSTLVNALAGQDRVIVSEVEGTTRDSVDVRFQIDDHVFTAIDTAGVRKRKSIKEDIEYYSTHRALRSVRRADVVVHLIDATVPVSQVDQQLAQEVLKHFKPCIVAVNKWDLVKDPSKKEEFVEYLDKELRGLNFAPIAYLCANKGEGVRDLAAMALNLHAQASHRVPTSELNSVMEQVLKEKPPTSKSGRFPKVYYVTQLATNPPTVALFVNTPQFFDNSYQRYLLNRMRDLLPFSEVPIKLVIRARRTNRGESEA
ncbi:MAG: ribosome biogenesis GTPase Der [Phycisphaera sp.]|nr:ribosome biogenesis GTPase Der [Phycisphaera sp.]